MAWFVFWWHFSSESPGTHRYISNEERIFIENSVTQNTSNVPNKVGKLSAIIVYISLIAA